MQVQSWSDEVMTTVKKLQDLTGRRALITGASGKLGQVIAETLAELGADLLLLDRPGADFQDLDGRLKKQWLVDAQVLECDLEIDSQREEIAKAIKCDSRGLNILINNAAFVGASNLQGWVVPFELQSLDVWRRAMEVNLTAAFHICQLLYPEMRRARGAAIINIASIYSRSGPNWSLYENTSMGNPAAYAASKGGLVQLTRWLATTMAPDVRVNAISPGGVLRNQPINFQERYVKRTPMGRMATEDDIRGAIAYFSSDMSKYTTGQNLFVDGGFGVW